MVNKKNNMKLGTLSAIAGFLGTGILIYSFFELNWKLGISSLLLIFSAVLSALNKK